MSQVHTLLHELAFRPFGELRPGEALSGDDLVCVLKVRVVEHDAYWIETATPDISYELILGHILIQTALLRRELGIVTDEESGSDDDGAASDDVEEQRVPVAEAFPNVELTLPELDDDERIEFALVLAKICDERGEEVGWSYRTSEAPNMEELLGALEVLRAELTRKLQSDWNA